VRVVGHPSLLNVSSPSDIREQTEFDGWVTDSHTPMKMASEYSAKKSIRYDLFWGIMISKTKTPLE